MSGAPELLPVDHGGPVDVPFEPFPEAALEGSILDRFDLMARRHAGRLAVQDGERSLTYGELAAAADAVAAALHAGLDRPGPVALLLPTGASLVAAMLGVLAAGRGYIPLDTTQPIARTRAILEQAGAAGLVADGPRLGEAREALAGLAPVFDVAAAPPAPRPALAVGPGDLAYIIYTSGSTGEPKGVWHVHRNCLNDVLIGTNNGHFGCEDRMALLYGGAVIASTRRIFAALLNGASLHIMDPVALGAAGVVEQVRRRGVTILHLVPTLLRRIAAAMPEGERLQSVRILRIAGERSDWSDYDLVRRICRPEALMAVDVGSTEVSSTFASWFVDEAVREPGARLPVGRRLPGLDVILAGEAGEAAGPEAEGEAVVSGRCLAFGYWRRPDLTAERFSTDPRDPGLRTFRTGDILRLRPDGLYEFVGRKDQMVKLRGHRLEPPEVESALRRCTGVGDAAVLVRRRPDGAPRALVAYVELTDEGRGLLPRHLMHMLSRQLPRYMLPAVIAVLPALPRLSHFKIDRMALERRDQAWEATAAAEQADPVTAEVAAAFKAVVGCEAVSPEDNLLTLGGDSLQMVDVQLELERRFGLEVPPEVMARSLSIRRLAGWIRPRLKGWAPAG